METKICSKCGVEKEVLGFHRFVKSKDGYKTICKVCIRVINKKPEIKEKRYKNRKDWGIKHKEEINNNKRVEYVKNRNSILERNKVWRQNNKEIKKNSDKQYRLNNKEMFYQKGKKYREENVEVIYKYMKDYREKNKNDLKIKKENYNKSYTGLSNKRSWYHRTKEKYSYIIAWRSVLHNSLKRFGTKKEEYTINLLGYSAIDLRENIKSKFKDDMCWDNYGEWHIDHIYPVSKFDKTEKQCIVNALENLQPLWKHENLSKSNKIIIIK